MWYRCFIFGRIIGSVIAIKHPPQGHSGMTDGFPVNDPLYVTQQAYLEAINVPGAWKRLTSTKMIRKKVTVALIDTGVKPDHPNLVSNLAEGYNVIDKNDDTHDRAGHGTSMAGILGATINNTKGIAGVMDLVNIIPIFASKSPTDQNLTAALDYVIRQREGRDIKFILMAHSDDQIAPYLVGKIVEADQAGILMIVTTGNMRENITTEKRYPCALTQDFDGVLCVGATEESRMRLAGSSNFASYLDIAAPGVGIMTTGNYVRYQIRKGTSAASAIVAGVAAMLYSVAPNLSPGGIKKILKDTSTKGLKDSTGKTTLPFGRVDADKAVAKLIER